MFIFITLGIYLWIFELVYVFCMKLNKSVDIIIQFGYSVLPFSPTHPPTPHKILNKSLKGKL